MLAACFNRGRAGTLTGDDRSPAWVAVQQALSGSEPRVGLERLRESGLVARDLPEIEVLFGIPQPARSHPEIDAGLHSLMTLEQAARLDRSPEVRFGALVHDIGKGTTPRCEWPRHKGHEERGVPLVDELCRRLRAPAAYRELGMRAARCHGLAHKAAELRPASLLGLLESWDAFADPDGLERLIVDRLGRQARAHRLRAGRLSGRGRAARGACRGRGRARRALQTLRDRRLRALGRWRAEKG